MRLPAMIRVTLLSSALFAAGCAPSTGPAETSAGAPVRIANPASEYCISQGGRVEIVAGDDGGQTGMCHLADGTVIEEWELFRRDHPLPGAADDPEDSAD